MPESREKIRAARPKQFRVYPEYQDSGVEWLGEVPSHWKLKRVGLTVVGCQNGMWGDEPDGEHDVICVRVADFDRVQLGVTLIDPTMRSVDTKLAKTRHLRSGDLLLEKSGGGERQPVGAVVMYDHEAEAVSSNFIARMPVADGFAPRFLSYLHAHLYAARVNTRSIKQSTGFRIWTVPAT